MAAVAELSFLLFALINNIHAEERIVIRVESDSYTFILPEEADSCLISRYVGEEKLVLWNTSALWSQNSTVPEDLRQRLSVVSRDNISYYRIQNLNHSDSGQYQEKCWGNVTYENNITVIVCSKITQNVRRGVYVRLGETVDLPCEGAADNQDIQWLKSQYWNSDWKRVSGDSVTSVMDNVEGRSQVVKTSSGLRIYNLTLTRIKDYTCLVMNQQQCVSTESIELKFDIPWEWILHTVGETAVLQCPAVEFTDDQPPLWKVSYIVNSYKSEVGRNYSLVLSSLQLNHSGRYSCIIYSHVQQYNLMVCPKSGPPAVTLFSEGDNVTFRCRGLEKGSWRIWFIKSNQTEGRFLHFHYLQSASDLMSRLNTIQRDGLLILSNVSLEDTGEYWCVMMDTDFQCVSSSRTILRSREPSGMDFTLYTVRSSLLPVLLVILCVVVVAVNQRTRRGEQRPAQTHS